MDFENILFESLKLKNLVSLTILRCASTDKQQELDLPSLRVDDSETARLSTTPRKTKDGGKDGSLTGSGVVASSSSTALATGSLSSKTGASSASSSSSSHVGRAMSHISGIKRPLSHSNSVTSEKVAKYGVETPNEQELGKVIIVTHPELTFDLFDLI